MLDVLFSVFFSASEFPKENAVILSSFSLEVLANLEPLTI